MATLAQIPHRSSLKPVLLDRSWDSELLADRRVQEELRQITGEIAWYEGETRKGIRLMLQYRLEIGKRLARAKALLPHGEFLSWAQDQFGWTPRHVQNHLKLAANAGTVSRLEPGTSLTMALAAITNDKPKNTLGEPTVQVMPRNQTICLIGEIEEGKLDCERLLEDMARIAALFGAPRTKWRTR